MSNLTPLAMLYLFLLWSALTLAFISPKTWTLAGLFMPEGLKTRGLEWLIRIAVFLGLGTWLDSLTWVTPHTALSQPGFYLGYFTLCLVLTLPALVYYLSVSQHHK